MADPSDPSAEGGTLRYRHRLPTRLWHWLNAATVVILLMSGLMIFNAHPRLYWGQYGANADPAWLAIGSTPAGGGRLRVGSVELPTTGVLGRWRDPDGNVQTRAFPWWATLPQHYSLAGARRWHLSFAWLFFLGGLAYFVVSLANRHFARDLAPTRHELRPSHIWRDVKDHARLRFHVGEEAARYNILQKLSYGGVIFVLIPGAVLTGCGMSPAFDAAFPWIVDLLGGRQSARSLHFLCAVGLALFIVVHLVMVVLAGPLNELRSMLTGWSRLPREARETIREGETA